MMCLTPPLCSAWSSHTSTKPMYFLKKIPKINRASIVPFEMRMINVYLFSDETRTIHIVTVTTNPNIIDLPGCYSQGKSLFVLLSPHNFFLIRTIRNHFFPHSWLLAKVSILSKSSYQLSSIMIPSH